MGIAKIVRSKRGVARKEPKSSNPYVHIAHKAYATVAARSESVFCTRVAKRLSLSKSNRIPMSLGNLMRHLEKHAGDVLVTTCTITNDERVVELPKMQICALRFTAAARARIEKAGGRCISFDELLMENPSGERCTIVQGKRSHRTVTKYFGAAGLPGSTTKAKGQVWGRRGLRGPHSW